MMLNIRTVRTVKGRSFPFWIVSSEGETGKWPGRGPCALSTFSGPIALSIVMLGAWGRAH